MSRTRVEVHCQFFPLVITVPMDGATVEDYDGMFAVLEGIYRRNEPFASIADTRFLRQMPTPVIRRKISEFSVRTQDVAARLTVANYVVVANVIVRGALQALDWVFESRPPRQVVGTYREAVEGAVEKLSTRGVAIPSSVRDYVARGAPDLHGGTR